MSFGAFPNDPGLAAIRGFANAAAAALPANTTVRLFLIPVRLTVGALLTIRSEAFVVVPAATTNILLTLGLCHADGTLYQVLASLPFPAAPALGAQQCSFNFQHVVVSGDIQSDANLALFALCQASTAAGTVTYASTEIEYPL